MKKWILPAINFISIWAILYILFVKTPRDDKVRAEEAKEVAPIVNVDTPFLCIKSVYFANWPGWFTQLMVYTGEPSNGGKDVYYDDWESSDKPDPRDMGNKHFFKAEEFRRSLYYHYPRLHKGDPINYMITILSSRTTGKTRPDTFECNGKPIRVENDGPDSILINGVPHLLKK